MERTCDICSIPYHAEARYVNRGQGLTCSKSCGTILSSRKRKNPKVPNTTCSYCNVEFYRTSSHKKSKSDKYYCTVNHQTLGAASGVHSTGPDRLVGPLRAKRVLRVCLSCGVMSDISVKYDSCTKCRKSKIIDTWLLGDNSVTLNKSRATGLPVDTKSLVKRYLLESRGDQCEVCGWDEKSPDGRSIIQMDHINGDCFDNRPENLKLLCPNHHAMTETYGSLNKGSGRAHRRKNG